MFRVVLAGLLFLLSSRAFAFKFPIEMIEGVDGARVIVYVNEKDLDTGVHWTPFDGAPPKTVEEVLTVVRAHLAKNPGMGTATLKEVQLRPVPRHESIWHYMVVMQSQANGKAVLRYYMVLMSGKLIAGIREPESYK